MPLEPPPLPPRLADTPLVVFIGTGLWALAAVVLLGAHLLDVRPLDEWFWTALCGTGLGLIGYGIFRWQRSAARRGSRSAQRGLTR